MPRLPYREQGWRTLQFALGPTDPELNEILLARIKSGHKAEVERFLKLVA